MDSLDVVLRAIEFHGPERLPMNYGNRDLECSDVVTVGYGPGKGFTPGPTGLTEWGYAWQTLDKTMGQPGNHPLGDWARLDDYCPPDPSGPERTAYLPDQLSAHQGRFIKATMGISGFNQATFLRGFEAFMSDLMDAPDRVERLLDMVFGFEEGILAQYCAVPVNAVQFYDDWGTQQGLMVSPDLWRRVFRPRYADQFAQIHRAGKKVWFHTCGNVHAIIGDLIDIGADVLELLQPDVMGLERLAADFGGRVCFCCSVDHQRVALAGSRDDIQRYADRLCTQLGGFDGGFIACIEDYSMMGMTDQTYQCIREAFGSMAYGISRPLPRLKSAGGPHEAP